MTYPATVRVPPARWSIPLPVLLVLIPGIFAIIGVALRYGAAVSVRPDLAPGEMFAALCRWDCGWYVRIAETGYDPFPVPTMINGGNWAFFPLYPVAVGLLAKLTGVATILVASLASIAVTWAAAIAAWPLVNRDLRAYTLLAAYLLAGPFSLYFTTFYTEALFFLLTVAVFAALARPNYVATGMFAGLLSATRIVGVFAGVAIAIQAFVDHRRAGGSIAGFVPAVLRRPDIVFALAVAPLGLFAYMAFLHFWMGDALAFAHVQRAWARTVSNPASVLWQALSDTPSSGWWPTGPQQLAAVSIVALGLAAWLAYRRAWAASVFSFLCLLVPLAAGAASMLRFSAALAPIVILGVTLLARSRVVFAIALLGFLVACWFVIRAWLTGNVVLV